jgi:hypothetical protein
MPREWGPSLASRLAVRGQFVRYVRLGDALAAAVRVEMPNLLRSPIRARDRNNREVRIDVLAGESVEYFDAVAGYSLAKYEVLTGGGELDGKPYAVRVVSLTTLDRASSSGLQHAGPPAPVSPPRAPKPKAKPAPGPVVYELTREDLPAAERLRSARLSVFGVTLGSSYEAMVRAVAGSGRPFQEIPLKGASLKGVSLFSGDDEASVGHRMALFVSRDNVIEEIHLEGTDRPMSRKDAPVYRGFDSIAAGRTRVLLNACMTNARLNILGDEDRATQKEFPGGHGSFFRRYEYDKAGFDLSHLRLTRKPASLGESPDVYEHCTLRLRTPGRPQ